MTSSARLRAKKMRHVAAPLRDETIDYMLEHMLPDGMKRSIGALAAMGDRAGGGAAPQGVCLHSNAAAD